MHRSRGSCCCRMTMLSLPLDFSTYITKMCSEKCPSFMIWGLFKQNWLDCSSIWWFPKTQHEPKRSLCCFCYFCLSFKLRKRGFNVDRLTASATGGPSSSPVCLPQCVELSLEEECGTTAELFSIRHNSTAGLFNYFIKNESPKMLVYRHSLRNRWIAKFAILCEHVFRFCVPSVCFRYFKNHHNIPARLLHLSAPNINVPIKKPKRVLCPRAFRRWSSPLDSCISSCVCV